MEKEMYVLLKHESESGYGSSTTVLGIFRSKELADEYLRRFEKAYKDEKDEEYEVAPYAIDCVEDHFLQKLVLKEKEAEGE